MENKNKHVMYVLRCSDHTLYTGYTNDLNKRLTTHNNRKGAKYTKSRTPVQCIYFEEYETKQEAMSAEYYFKKKTRQQKLQYIEESRLENDSISNE